MQINIPEEFIDENKRVSIFFFINADGSFKKEILDFNENSLSETPYCLFPYKVVVPYLSVNTSEKFPIYFAWMKENNRLPWMLWSYGEGYYFLFMSENDALAFKMLVL